MMVPLSHWLRWLESPDYLMWAKRVYGLSTPDRKPLFQKLLTKAADVLSLACPGVLVRCPGRVNLMGRHIDHRGGRCHPIAIPREILVFASRADDPIIRLYHTDSDRYPDQSFPLSSAVVPRPLSDSEWKQRVRGDARARSQSWALYCQAALATASNWSWELGITGLLKGTTLIVSGDIPPEAGLSSSSALFVACLLSLIALYGRVPADRVRLSEIGGMGEWFVGTRGGSGDHAAILLSQRDRITVVDFFPLTVSHIPFPSGAAVVVMDSAERAHKASGARRTFNKRVLEYELGVLLWRHQFPELKDQIGHLRDASPYRLGSDDASYRLLKSLPPETTVAQLTRAYPELKEEIERIVAQLGIELTPDESLNIRGTCWFGLAECERSLQFSRAVSEGNWFQAAHLMRISHDGDRVVTWEKQKPEEFKFPLDDSSLERCRSSQTPLHLTAGSYRCSTPGIDFLVDGVLQRGCLGAQLCGAGLGGSVLVISRDSGQKHTVQPVLSDYQRVFKRQGTCFLVTPIAGAEVLTAVPT